MFRLAVARTSRSYAPGLIQCRRFKSDIPKPPASTSKSEKPTDTPPAPAVPKPAAVQSKPKEELFAAKQTAQSKPPQSSATTTSGTTKSVPESEKSLKDAAGGQLSPKDEGSNPATTAAVEATESVKKPQTSLKAAKKGQLSPKDKSGDVLELSEKPWSPYSRFKPQDLPLPDTYDAQTEEEYHAMLIHGRSLHPAHSHPQTHGIPVAIIHFRSHFPHLLTLFTHVALHAAAYLGIPTSGVISLPTQRRLWTVLRSPFIYKKSQENFERRVHKRAIKAYDADPEVVERWAQYLRKRRLGGVGIRVVKWVHVEVGIGRTHLGHIQLDQEGDVSAEKIRDLGDKIAQEELAPKAAKENTASPN